MYAPSKRKICKAAALILLLLLLCGEGHSKTRADVEHKIIFPYAQISLAGTTLQVELAKTEKERSQGLMNRKELSFGSGMLFEFPKEEILVFWMKNTKIPLSIAFFDKNKKLIEIMNMKVEPKNTPEGDMARYTSSKPAKYALEVPQGWFELKPVKRGEAFSFEKF